MRVVIWFSCGACSTVAAKIAIDNYRHLYLRNTPIEIVYCDTGGEHPDNMRYLKDAEQWLAEKTNTKLKIKILKNPKYKDHFDVFEKTKFLISPQGARCTGELKKLLRHQFQKPDDIQVFGYSFNEQHRADRFRELYPEINVKFPLIEHKLTKQQAIGYLWKEGLKLPEMYKLGYNNNNCIGCVKGGKGYWNKIRKDFPQHFERMSKIERSLNIKIHDIFLDEMGENEGNHTNEQITCDFMCQSLT